MGIVDFFLFIFRLLIISGITIAGIVLVVSAIYWLASAGKPERIKEARSRILAALLGIIILISSYIILRTINVQLVEPYVARLEKHEDVPIPPPPPTKPRPGDSLARIRQIAEDTKTIIEEIQKISQDTKDLTDKCDCKYAESICLCTGGSEFDWCQPHQCYIGLKFNPYFHPCPDDIQPLQSALVDYRDAILYYRNRIYSPSQNPKDIITDEISDLEYNINQFLNKKIEYCQDQINIEKNKPNPNQESINFWEEQKNKIIKERNYKRALINKLGELVQAISTIERPINKLLELPDQCLSDLNIACEASCKEEEEEEEEEEDYGCHDKTKGCQPDECIPKNPEEPNPCPTEEIGKQVENIHALKAKIAKICISIITIIDNI